jgi:hypothetical protein
MKKANDILMLILIIMLFIVMICSSIDLVSSKLKIETIPMKNSEHREVEQRIIRVEILGKEIPSEVTWLSSLSFMLSTAAMLIISVKSSR